MKLFKKTANQATHKSPPDDGSWLTLPLQPKYYDTLYYDKLAPAQERPLASTSRIAERKALNPTHATPSRFMLNQKLLTSRTAPSGPTASSLLREVQEAEETALARTPTAQPLPRTVKPRIEPKVTTTSTAIPILDSKAKKAGSIPRKAPPSPHSPAQQVSASAPGSPPLPVRLSLPQDSVVVRPEASYPPVRPIGNEPSIFSRFWKPASLVPATCRHFLQRIFSRAPAEFPHGSGGAQEEAYLVLPASLRELPVRAGIHTIKLEEPADIHAVLNILRHGNSVILLDYSSFSNNLDLLRGIIKKLKHTKEAIDGDLVGIGDSWLVATTKGITIERMSLHSKPKNPYTQPTARPSAMSWENFEAWKETRKKGEGLKLETY